MFGFRSSHKEKQHRLRDGFYKRIAELEKELETAKYKQKEAEERHWQFAGPEGVILTEVANVHDNDGVRHSDTNLVFG